MTEEEVLRKRLSELAQKSYQSSIYTFTNFLGEAQLDTALSMERELSYAGMKLWGGMEGTGRQVLRFGDPKQLGYEEEFPIVCLVMEPLIRKFAEDLTHRDFLGALMNLGIERELLGDIVVKDRTGYLFCLERIAPYIMQELDQVRHTHIRVRQTKELPDEIKPEEEEQTIIVNAQRLDAVIAKVYHLSRSQSIGLFREKKVFVCGRQCENNSYVCKEQDIISVRGYGKFVFAQIQGTTGKGRLSIRILRYV